MTALVDWLVDTPDIVSIRTAVADLNGQARGKRVPVGYAAHLADNGARMPLSALNLDIRGDDISDSPLVFATGDADGVLRPTDRGFLPIPWLETPAALLPMWMFQEDGQAFAGDPRHALDQVLARYAARGWQPICAAELEFTLLDASSGTLQPPERHKSAGRATGGHILSLAELDEFEAFFAELHAGADAMGIAPVATTSEAGRGQFEVSLGHCPAMKAADDTFFFKMLVRGLARKHGMSATFMAKPYGDDAGNGLHTHVSVVDRDGRNVFDNGGASGSDILLASVAGCLRAMADSTLIFAPHANSYDRLVPGAHAPTGIAWAYENRTTAIRVPGGSSQARRFEHRVAGGDANPYLLFAAVLGAAVAGVDKGLSPPAPIAGNAYEQTLPSIPGTWADSVERFETSELLPDFLPVMLIENFTRTKRQEMRVFANLSDQERHRLYLDTV
ncbi:MAG: glutamine synthetase family protein [Pseudomonadota bacterium]